MKIKIVPVLMGILLPLSLFAQKNLPDSGARDYTVAIAWQQYSGEYRALCFQAYNFAKLSLSKNLSEADTAKLNCVVVDIDETILDNSRFQGHEVKKGLSYNVKDWSDWTAMGVADTVPGALSFLLFAKAQNVTTFYVTNRDETDYKGTLANLEKFGFPYADAAHLMIKTSTSDKEPRRKKIMEKYNVLLFCGDNLSDFSNVFYREGKNTFEATEHLRQQFGSRFIVLPNPMYGDWEKSLYKGGELNETERSRQRTDGLKAY